MLARIRVIISCILIYLVHIQVSFEVWVSLVWSRERLVIDSNTEQDRCITERNITFREIEPGEKEGG